jgi:hypothetical protein
VIDPLEITNNPVSQSVTNGGTACFSVGVSGTPPFFYQWLFSGAEISGATASTYCVTNATATQAGPYTVTVSQILGPEDIIQATSSPAILTVGPSLLVQAPPSPATIRGQVRLR